jgi:hypothetical protein
VWGGRGGLWSNVFGAFGHVFQAKLLQNVPTLTAFDAFPSCRPLLYDLPRIKVLSTTKRDALMRCLNVEKLRLSVGRDGHDLSPLEGLIHLTELRLKFFEISPQNVRSFSRLVCLKTLTFERCSFTDGGMLELGKELSNVDLESLEFIQTYVTVRSLQNLLKWLSLPLLFVHFVAEFTQHIKLRDAFSNCQNPKSFHVT